MPANDATLFLPGILSRSYEVFQPIAHLFPGRLIGIDDIDKVYRHSDMIDRMVNELFRFRERDQAVTLVGASIGGMKIPFVIEEYRRLYPQKSLDFIRQIIIIDAPSEPETLAPLPSWAVGFMASPAGVLLSPVSKIVVGPKDEEISIPSEEVMQRLCGQVMNGDEWRKYVKKTVKSGLRGYPMLRWRSWNKWMIDVGRDGSLARAVTSLDAIDTTYISCDHSGNVTVKQPDAAAWWTDSTDIKLASVPAVHCAFLQQQPEFESALAPLVVK